MPSRLPEPVDLGDLLEPFARRGSTWLERVRAALASGGHPERGFPAIQVAGTNGKGSICTMLHAILRAAGWRCASYRSPHLLSWCERIQLNDDWITADELRSDLIHWQPIGRRHRLTPFELLTVAAFDRFAREAVDLAVLEVGLGGRLDATTAHPDRGVVGFATIDLDHQEHLGDTLAAIAFEKAGVLAPGCLAISGPQHPQVARVLRAEAIRTGARLRWVDPLAPAALGGPLLGLAGDLQRTNGAVAMAMAEALVERGWPATNRRLTPDAIRAGLASASWPGRLERRHWHGRELLIDGAHNPAAAAALRRELNQWLPAPFSSAAEQGPRRWLLGIQRHKEGADMLRELLQPGDLAGIVSLTDHPAGAWTIWPGPIRPGRPACTDRHTSVGAGVVGSAWNPAGGGRVAPPAGPRDSPAGSDA